MSRLSKQPCKRQVLSLLGMSMLAGMVGFSSVSAAADRELKIYNWMEYTPKSVLDQFQSETGIKITYDVFDSAEILEAKLLSGNSGYDVVFPTHAQIPKLIKAQAIMPLDKSKLSNWKNLDPQFLSKIATSDPGNKYAAPYMWGTTTIGYNKQAVQKALGADVDLVNSWDLIFKPEHIAKLKNCGVAFLDSPGDIYPLALNYLGLDPQTQNPEDYKKAQALILSIRENIKYFHSAKYATDLAAGDICVAVGWSGGMVLARAAAEAAKNGIEVGISLPKEGTLAWSDDMAIAAGAKNFDEAHEFINFILRPEIIAQISNYIGYPNPNLPSLELIDPAVRADKNLFIPSEQMSLLFFPAPLSLKAERNSTRLWNSIRTAK